MGAASKLERLVRIVPVVAGYQDRENARETDKLVRMRLSDELRHLMGDVEEAKRRLTDARDLSQLALLDRLAGKLEKLGRTLEYAGRGYRGLFDLHKVEMKTLEQLYAFDVGLFETLTAVKPKAPAGRHAPHEPRAVQRA